MGNESTIVSPIVNKALRKRVFSAWASKVDNDYPFLHQFDIEVYELGLKVMDKRLDMEKNRGAHFHY